VKKKPALCWTLSISTWRDSDPDAIHFYGRLRNGLKIEDVENFSQLGTTIKFETKEEVIFWAKEWLRKRYPRGFKLKILEVTN
jgi:hypothetical protein